MAEGSGRIIGLIVLVGCGVASYLAWQNGKLSHESEAAAKAAACADPTCMVTDARPRLGQADAIRHRYEFMTTMGLKAVTCKRKFYLAGEWQCSSRDGRITEDPW